MMKCTRLTIWPALFCIILCPIMNKKAVIKCSNHRQEISQLKPHIFNPIKKFMQLSLQADASSDFST